MELKAYIQLIKRHLWLFFMVWGVVVAGSLLWLGSRPVRFDVSVPVEVVRSGKHNTGDYQYDQYYRLQADEKFAETVSQWLKDPTVAVAILHAADQRQDDASLRALSKMFRAEKLAATFVQIRFQVSQITNADIMTEAIRKILNDRTQAMNQQAQAPDWFALTVGTPTVIQSRISTSLVCVAAALGGLLVALLAISIMQYWKED